MVLECDVPVGMTRPEPRKIAIMISTELKLEVIIIAAVECRLERDMEESIADAKMCEQGEKGCEV